MRAQLVYQYVGALSEAHGLTNTIRRLDSFKVFERLEVPPQKDPKRGSKSTFNVWESPHPHMRLVLP